MKIKSSLIHTYSFDNFIEGDSNKLARSAGWAISENPGKTAFSPLIVYGGVGQGKTHLLHAIGLQVQCNHPEKTVFYIGADDFSIQYDKYDNSSKLTDFYDLYHSIDVLIIDDIQQIHKTQEVQNALLNIYNHLFHNNKQLILSSDVAPSNINGFNEKLLSRFNSGLLARLDIPDVNTRIQIIQKKLYKDGIEMPHDVIEYLASKISTNIRELENVLITVLAQSTLNKKTMDIEMLEKILASRNSKYSEIFDIPIPGLIKAVQQYLTFFDEYVKEAKGKEIKCVVTKTKYGVQLDIEFSSDLKIEEVEKFLEEYTSFIFDKDVDVKQKIEVEKYNHEVEMLKLRIDLQKEQFFNEARILKLENQILSNHNENIKNWLKPSNAPAVINNIRFDPSLIAKAENTSTVVIDIGDTLNALEGIKKDIIDKTVFSETELSELRNLINELNELNEYRNNKTTNDPSENIRLKDKLKGFLKVFLQRTKDIKTTLIDFPDVLERIKSNLITIKKFASNLNFEDILHYFDDINRQL